MNGFSRRLKGSIYDCFAIVYCALIKIASQNIAVVGVDAVQISIYSCKSHFFYGNLHNFSREYSIYFLIYYRNKI